LFEVADLDEDFGIEVQDANVAFARWEPTAGPLILAFVTLAVLPTMSAI
jgi:hypothetical protein